VATQYPAQGVDFEFKSLAYKKLRIVDHAKLTAIHNISAAAYTKSQTVYDVKGGLTTTGVECKSSSLANPDCVPRYNHGGSYER
jgi:hypothetical protein